MSAAIDTPDDGPGDEEFHLLFCPECKQKIRKAWGYRMCGAKVRMLDILARGAVMNEGGWMKITAGMFPEFNGNDQVAAMILEWYLLVEHGPVRSGLYRITMSGLDFLKGTLEVPTRIFCKDGRVFSWDDTMVTVGSVKDVFLDKAYWDAYCHVPRNDL